VSDGALVAVFVLSSTRNSSKVAVYYSRLYAAVGTSEFTAFKIRMTIFTKRLPDCVRVVVISRRLRQQENVFVRLGWSIPNTFRHGVRLVPDNIGPQIPAVRLQRECDAPRDSDEVFRF